MVVLYSAFGHMKMNKTSLWIWEKSLQCASCFCAQTRMKKQQRCSHFYIISILCWYPILIINWVYICGTDLTLKSDIRHYLGYWVCLAYYIIMRGYFYRRFLKWGLSELNTPYLQKWNTYLDLYEINATGALNMCQWLVRCFLWYKTIDQSWLYLETYQTLLQTYRTILNHCLFEIAGSRHIWQHCNWIPVYVSDY